MKKIIEIVVGMAAMYGCLYILLGTLTLIELFFNIKQ